MLLTSEIGRLGVWDKGTDSSPVILLLTALKVWPVDGDVMAAPLQFSLYSISEVFPVAVLNFVLEFLDCFDRMVELCRVRPRRCSRLASPLFDRCAARAEEANITLLRRAKESFIIIGYNQCT